MAPEQMVGLALICASAKPLQAPTLDALDASRAAVQVAISVEGGASGLEAALRLAEPERVAAFARFDRLAQLGDVQVPTLVLRGERDEVFPVTHTKELLSGIASAELAVVPGGHFAPYTHPSAVADALASWVAGLSRSTS
jgi:pimeloyl-ACP methyl ester carboxylesterase